MVAYIWLGVIPVKACVWEGVPAFWTPGEAWALVDGAWTRVDDADVGNSAKVVSEAEFGEMFDTLPELPKDAFQASDKASTAGL